MKSLKVISLILGLLSLLVFSYFYRQQALNLRFVDEEDNLVIGKYVAKGEKIYDDIISNHQPLTYILSAQVEKLTHPQNGYFLIMRHREAVIVWSLVWSILLIYSFGFATLGCIVIYELTKIHLLGNLFLAESFAVYPTLYLLGSVFEKRLTKLEIFLLGLSFGLSLFLLLPIWPVLFFMFLFLFIKQKEQIAKIIKYFIAGFLPVLAIVFFYSSAGGIYTIRFLSIQPILSRVIKMSQYMSV